MSGVPTSGSGWHGWRRCGLGSAPLVLSAVCVSGVGAACRVCVCCLALSVPGGVPVPRGASSHLRVGFACFLRVCSLRAFVHGSHMVTPLCAMCVGPLLWCRTCSRLRRRRVGDALRPALNSFIHHSSLDLTSAPRASDAAEWPRPPMCLDAQIARGSASAIIPHETRVALISECERSVTTSSLSSRAHLVRCWPGSDSVTRFSSALALAPRQLPDVTKHVSEGR